MERIPTHVDACMRLSEREINRESYIKKAYLNGYIFIHGKDSLHILMMGVQSQLYLS